MFIIRIMMALALIAFFVLLAAFLITRNKQYLNYIKRLTNYLVGFVVVVGLLFLISRIIRL